MEIKCLGSSDSSVLHGASSAARKNHLIRRVSPRAFREHGIISQSMDQVKRYDGLQLLNEHRVVGLL